MRVSDFVARRLKYLGCEDVYMVTGGAAMHLNDSFGYVFGEKVHWRQSQNTYAFSKFIILSKFCNHNTERKDRNSSR